MNRKPTTSGLGPDKLAEILNVFSEEDTEKAELSPSQIKAELLQDRLAETLLSGSAKNSPFRKELTHLCSLAGLISDEPIRSLLSSHETNIDLLVKIKEHGKRMTTDSSSEAEHETANVIYYTAIASALIYHGDKITRSSYEDMEKAFSVFIDTEWISSDLIGLFEKAAEYCKEKARSND